MDSARRSWKLQEFVGHKANVNCLAMGHKSNQVLATGGDDKKVNLWAIGRQSCLMSLSGHTTPVECVCFGHSEDLVCAGSQTGALKIWDLEAVKLLRTFSGHKGAIKCMDFHPYGDYLTTGSCDSNIKLWDTRKRDCIVTYSSHRLAVNSIQFSPDGQWIASACDDGLVKVWDVRIGKVLKEFEEHDGAVSCVKFHPHEFLLASCAADGTVNFWDMEKFQLVSKFQKPHAPIRHMLFSADGNALLCACSEGLTVLGWEPVRELDVVAATWGHVQDLTMAHTQLIAGSFHSTYIQLSVVDMNKVHPFGGPPPATLTSAREPPSPFQKGQSVRKSFSKEKPAREVIHRPTKLDEKTVEESTSSTENDDDSALIPTCSDYKGVFKPSRALTRTPPPPDATSEDDYSISGTSTCKLEPTGTSLRELLSEDRPPVAPPSPPQRQRPHTTRDYAAVPKHADTCTRVSDNKEGAPAPARDLRVPVTPPPSLNRHNSYKETKSTTNLTNNLRPSNSDMNLAPPALGQRSLSFTRANSETSRRPEPRREVVARESPDTEFVPFAADRPVGLDLDEFLPRSRGPGSCGRGGAASEQEVLGAVMRGHDAMMTVLVGRQRALQIFHSVRVNKSLKIALESVIALEDMSVILDILNVMAHKPSIWNLDICLLMLPKIHELLQSKYESYMQCGCNALRLIMRNFSSVVRANVAAPRGQGVDIPREERSAKCSRIHQMLLETRAFLLKRQTMQGRLGAAFRDLHALMQQGLD